MQSKGALRLFLIPKLSEFFYSLILLILGVVNLIYSIFAYPFPGFLLMLAFSIGFGWKPATALVNAFKTVSELDASGELDAVLREFSEAQSLMKGQLRLGEKHIFGKGAGILHPYPTLSRIYQHVEKLNGAEVKRELRAVGTNGVKYTICRLPKSKKYAEELQTAAMLIAAAQPSIVFGAPPL